MIRFVLPFLVLPAALAIAEEMAEMPDLAADALAKQGAVAGLEFARPSQSGAGQTMCATSNARDGNGNFVGLTYWQLEFNADGTEVVAVRNMTGLLSDCYGMDYERYGN